MNRKTTKALLEEILVSKVNNFDQEELFGLGMRNTASLRRVLFFKHFLANKGNATRAAIAAGYSSKSAKQQGYKVLMWFRKEIASGR